MTSDNQNFGGFGKFVPGFDFLQTLAQGAAQNVPQMPSLSNWVAPTLNVEELDKRIGELKAVQFWLDQNGKALGATIQALEVQKMTLSTLKGMNFHMGDIANALKLKTGDAMFTGVQKAGEKAAASVDAISQAAQGAAARTQSKPDAGKPDANASTAGVVDPLQWWGALTQQFQQIAAGAMKDAGKNTAVEAARTMASGVAKEAFKTATGMAKAATGGAVSGAGARKAAKKTTGRSR